MSLWTQLERRIELSGCWLQKCDGRQGQRRPLEHWPHAVRMRRARKHVYKMVLKLVLKRSVFDSLRFFFVLKPHEGAPDLNSEPVVQSGK